MAVFVSVLRSVFLLFVLGASSAMSGSLPRLPADDRASLSAVGVIRSAGRNGSTLCSGTLVARDLVITSAHCIKQNAGLLHNFEFTAGVNGTRFVANSGSVEVLQHPVWRNTSGVGKFRYDVAVVRLSRPIARGRVQPRSDFIPKVKRFLSAGRWLDIVAQRPSRCTVVLTARSRHCQIVDFSPLTARRPEAMPVARS